MGFRANQVQTKETEPPPEFDQRALGGKPEPEVPPGWEAWRANVPQ
jgi:hypothetical protein